MTESVTKALLQQIKVRKLENHLIKNLKGQRQSAHFQELLSF